MALDEGISGLIGRIYEGADDLTRWEQVLLDLKVRMEACCVLETVADLRHRELSRSRFYGSGGARFVDGIAEYREGHYVNDPSFQFASRNPTARFCATEDILPSDDYLRHPFIRWNKPVLGSTHWLVGYSAPADELTLGISVHPSADVGPLPEDKKALFKLLFEHMERAVRLASRPPAFVGDEEPLILLDRHGCIREVSPAAQKVLAEKDGLSIRRRQLQASSMSASRKLSAAILSALRALEDGGYGGAVSLPRPSGKRDLLVTVTPLLNPPSPFEAFRPAALARLIDPELKLSPSASCRWSDLFALTRSEARLAETLMNGDQNLRQSADRLGIAYATARVHLKRILEKTGTHSQVQLAVLLSRF